MPRQSFALLPAIAALLFFPVISHAQSDRTQTDQSMLPLMPLPAHVQPGTGTFVIDGNFAIQTAGYDEPRLQRAQLRFLDHLTSETGIPFRPQPVTASAHFIIQTGGPGKAVQELGEDESYTLTVTAQDVHLQAPNPLGILHGLQTFLQLVHSGPQGPVVDATSIQDQPRFPWRGLMIDAGRHFMPISVIRQNLDGMEAYKLNVFHWHMSEDQGFRFESKRFPLLQEKGSDGLYYTQDEIRDTVDYARDRGIRVVPEFDMPGHASSWFVGYPDLASGSGPYQIIRNWGVFDPAMDPTRDSTYKFLDTLIGEIVTLFPDAYFHMGGDECNGKEWDRNPRIQAFMREHNLKDVGALQAYFTTKVQEIIAKHHKIGEGWDEVLLPGTPKDVVIQSWRGADSLAQAARDGYRGILSAGYYLDHTDHAEDHYLVDPLGGAAASLTPQQQKNILGGEAAMWSEYVSSETVNSRIWPRTAAIAERLWSPQDVRNVPDMYRRLDLVLPHLAHYGIRPADTGGEMLARIAGPTPLQPLLLLSSAVEPIKGLRGADHYDAFTPLDRLVDAVPPESSAALQFKSLIDAVIAKTATTSQINEARTILTVWRNNDTQLQAAIPESYLMSDLAAISTSLHTTADIGLAALDGTAVPSDVKQQQIAFLEAASKPQGVLLNVIAPIIEQLVKSLPTQ